MCNTKQKNVVAAQCSVTVVPPPVIDGGEGAGDSAVVIRQVCKGGHAKLVDGVTTPCIAGKGTIDPSILPLCSVVSGRERLLAP
jgi:hypothetical protein